MPDTGVDERVEQIDKEHAQRRHQDNHVADALNDREILVEDRVVKQLAHPVIGKDALHQHLTCDQQPHL